MTDQEIPAAIRMSLAVPANEQRPDWQLRPSVGRTQSNPADSFSAALRPMNLFVRVSEPALTTYLFLSRSYSGLSAYPAFASLSSFRKLIYIIQRVQTLFKRRRHSQRLT